MSLLQNVAKSVNREQLRERMQREACHLRGYAQEVSKAAMIGDAALFAEDLSAVLNVALRLARTLTDAGYHIDIAADLRLLGPALFECRPDESA